MATIKLPHFGHIDTEALDEYYDATIEFNGSNIQIDLNFESKTVDAKRLEVVKNFIENIRIHDGNNKKHIEQDYNDTNGDTVRFYLQHHLKELGEDDLAGLIDMNSKSTAHEKLLLKKLRLIRVGIYPDSEDQFGIFDYSIGEDLTNYLVVLFTDENGNLDYMTMES